MALFFEEAAPTTTRPKGEWGRLQGSRKRRLQEEPALPVPASPPEKTRRQEKLIVITGTDLPLVL